MDLLPNHKSPVLADPVPTNRPRFGLSMNLLSYSSLASAFPSSLLLSTPRRKLIPGILDDCHNNGWLDAMTASSPPPVKFNRELGSDGVLDENENAYHTWMLKYPSAISSFEHIATHAKDKRVALFLDYDGTLSPIVDNPECAFMSSEMRSAVKHVAEHFPTAIISGRSRDKVLLHSIVGASCKLCLEIPLYIILIYSCVYLFQVYDFVGLTELYYAGSHGMDIMGPVRESDSVGDHPNCIRTTDKQGKEVNLFQPASKFIPMIEEVYRLLVENTKGIKGATVENNKFCVSVHYRLVQEKNWPAVSQIVFDILKEYPFLKLTHGRKVLEIRPVIDWNKGKAVEFLLESLELSNSSDVLAIYVGDDRTDEDAFKVLREGNRGHGILVSSTPKESSAFYSLRDPSEVMYFLKSLVRWKNSSVLGC